MIALPFLLFHPTFAPFPKATWFNSTSELLNFGAAIMNLMLWTTLAIAKQRAPQLILVSAGSGIVVTGTAMSYAIRYLVWQSQFAAAGYFFMNLTQLGGWATWCWAFQPSPFRSVLQP